MKEDIGKETRVQEGRLQGSTSIISRSGQATVGIVYAYEDEREKHLVERFEKDRQDEEKETPNIRCRQGLGTTWVRVKQGPR